MENGTMEDTRVDEPASRCLTQSAVVSWPEIQLNNGAYSMNQLQMWAVGPNLSNNQRSSKVDGAVNLNNHGERAWYVAIKSPYRCGVGGGIYSSLRLADARAKEMMEVARDEDDVVIVQPVYVNGFPGGAPKLLGLR